MHVQGIAKRNNDAAASIVRGNKMSLSQRKLLGIPLLMFILIAYAVIASIIYEQFLVGAHTVFLLVYFCIAGSCWFFPAAWAVRWMSARPGELPPNQD